MVERPPPAKAMLFQHPSCAYSFDLNRKREDATINLPGIKAASYSVSFAASSSEFHDDAFCSFTEFKVRVSFDAMGFIDEK